MKIASLIALAAAGCASAATNSWTLVSETEAEPIHSAIVRKEAWTIEPVRRLRLEAERCMREGLWSVTYDRPAGIQLDPHEYYSQSPYYWPQADPRAPYVRKDGLVNPNRFMANENALDAMSDAVFTLGTAAYLLDEPRYAKRAVHILYVWFVDGRTRMNASLEHARSVRNFKSVHTSGVLDGRAFIRAIQGMEFMVETGEWDQREQAAVRKWFREYLHWLAASDRGLEEKRRGDSHATWWSAQTLAIATFTGDAAAQAMAENWYREQNLGRQILASGAAPREEARAVSLSYSAFNLEAMATVCRIAQVNGVDLWTARSKNGAGIATVIDYLTPYLSNPRNWPKPQIVAYKDEGPYSLAFAGMGLKKPEYVAQYRRLEHGSSAWLAVVNLLVGRWESAGHQTRH